MKQSKTTGFIVFDFMVEEMGLGGVELLVFALFFHSQEWAKIATARLIIEIIF